MKKIKLNLRELLHLADEFNAASNLRKKKEVMEKHSLSNTDVKNILKALRRGSFKVV